MVGWCCGAGLGGFVEAKAPGGRNERIYEKICRIMMRRFPPGERKINMRDYIINGRNVFVKGRGKQGKREEKKHEEEGNEGN